MTWVRLDDQFFHNRKARSVGPEGRELFMASACYCAIQLNDGVFPASDLPVIAALAEVEPSVADRLFRQAMWHDEGFDCPKCRSVGQFMPVPPGHIAVHEYLRDNPSREKVISERDAAAERQRRSREKSRRESRVTANGSHAVTSPAPVPVPSPTDTALSSSGNSRAELRAVDDEELSTVVPDETWDHYADLKLAQQTDVRNASSWKRTCKRNAKVEEGHLAERWWSMFELTPRRLAECLVDGQAPRNVNRRAS